MNRTKLTPTSILILVIIIGVFVYQCNYSACPFF